MFVGRIITLNREKNSKDRPLRVALQLNSVVPFQFVGVFCRVNFILNYHADIVLIVAYQDVVVVMLDINCCLREVESTNIDWSQLGDIAFILQGSLEKSFQKAITQAMTLLRVKEESQKVGVYQIRPYHTEYLADD